MASMSELVTDPRAWSEIANAYELGARKRLAPFSERAIEWAALGPDDEVLDVACGPGTTALLAARHVRSVHALDFAEEMIAALRRNAHGLHNVTAILGDGQRLSFADQSFSVAFSMFGLMFFPDPVAGLRELHRVLRPGGRVLISSWVPMGQSPMMRPLGAALMHAVPPAPDQAPPKPFAFSSAGELTRGLREAGFVDVEVEAFTPEIPVASPDAYWEEMQENLFVTDLRKSTGEGWPALEAVIRDHLRATLTGVTALEMPGLIGLGHRR